MAAFTNQLQRLVHAIHNSVPVPSPSAESIKNAKIIAHRGSWNLTDRPENTLAAFDHALTKNTWGIEFDVRWTKDGQPVVFHDVTTGRLFPKDRAIGELTLAEVQKLFPLIPTLEDVVRRYGDKTHLMIELKEGLNAGRANELKRILAPLAPQEAYHIMSLKPDILASTNFVDPKTLVSISQFNARDIFKKTLENKWGGFTGYYLFLNGKIMTESQARNIITGTGFLDSKNLFHREVNRGIPWIFTNNPSALTEGT